MPIPNDDMKENTVKAYPIQVPFLRRLLPHRGFLDIIWVFNVGEHYNELMAQVPSYAKFIKQTLYCERDASVIDTVAMTEECSALLQTGTPSKLSDPGSFSIPCHIGTQLIDNALCDLGASVNVLPLSLATRLGLTKFKRTSITVQMADRSLSRPKGVLDDVPVRIGKFFILVYFVVLDIPEDRHIPIILGRPFLRTAGAIIDVGAKTLTFQVGGEDLVFTKSNACREPMRVMSYDATDKECRRGS
ncbi:uncharacterized protein LOC141620124 [Silene latifolia]|uniref:uncharacterized protein LOC141620124 n=1 Tax=Silene latifolia TaxID=37657 RepID=UPI003D77B2AA